MSDDSIQQIILDELRAHREESRERHEKMDVRVNIVEKWQATADGKISAFGIICVAIGGFIAWLTKVIQN